MSAFAHLSNVGTLRHDRTGLDLLAKGAKPDLFMLDLNMPGMSGIELLKHIRALAPHRFTPALMLTTETGAGRRAEAKAAGASGWLVKPIAPPDLLRVVKQVCAKAG
jgi:two-component system, chemotaxis family, chemotaxis protein CheY